MNGNVRDMAASQTPPNAIDLRAILLVIRSRPGPRLVFHYPSSPQISPPNVNRTSSDDDSDSEAEPSNSALRAASRNANAGEKYDVDKEYDASTSAETSSVDGLLGFSKDSLEKLLSPGRWSYKKKFEVTLDDFTFVGHPIYADQDGDWKRKNGSGNGLESTQNRPSTPSKPIRIEANGDESGGHLGVSIIEPKTPGIQFHDFKHVPESFDSQAATSLATSFNSESTMSAVAPEQLTMFHVVFVTTSHGSSKRSNETSGLYRHVAKRLGKSLQYCQKQSNYVASESRKILALKVKAKQEGTNDAALSEQILETSELAWAMKEVFLKISAGEVAGIRLNGMELSLQIQSVVCEREVEKTIEQHSSLLLLEDKDVLLRELVHPEASPLAYFIREHTPTKSLAKQAGKLGMSINSILYLARHLIKWRKARAIPPLHPRNSYIVAPNAPLDKLEEYIPKYATRFSALPSLPQLLKILSGKPIKYGMLIPSRDHRGPYMDILAYLVRYKFVEQLTTFGWLQASLGLMKKAGPKPEVNENRRPMSVISLLSPQMRPVDDDSASISSERTAIPLSVADAPRRQNELDKNLNKATSNQEDNSSQSRHIIINPVNPSVEDEQRIEFIRESVDDDELHDRLPSLLCYFDGEHAFEEIAAKEGLKRSKVESWLEVLQKDGFLLTYRHL